MLDSIKTRLDAVGLGGVLGPDGAGLQKVPISGGRWRWGNLVGGSSRGSVWDAPHGANFPHLILQSSAPPDMDTFRSDYPGAVRRRRSHRVRALDPGQG